MKKYTIENQFAHTFAFKNFVVVLNYMTITWSLFTI